MWEYFLSFLIYCQQTVTSTKISGFKCRKWRKCIFLGNDATCNFGAQHSSSDPHLKTWWWPSRRIWSNKKKTYSLCSQGQIWSVTNKMRVVWSCKAAVVWTRWRSLMEDWEFPTYRSLQWSSADKSINGLFHVRTIEKHFDLV